MPMRDGTFCLGVLKAIQEAAGVKRGDVITVELELDTAPRTVEPPPDVAREIARDKRAAVAWDKLSYTNKKEMALSLEEARKPETPRAPARRGARKTQGPGPLIGVAPSWPAISNVVG